MKKLLNQSVFPLCLEMFLLYFKSLSIELQSFKRQGSAPITAYTFFFCLNLLFLVPQKSREIMI